MDLQQQPEIETNFTEESLAMSRDLARFAEPYERLSKNPDFQMIFQDFFFDEEVKRYALLLEDPNMASRKPQIAKALSGISTFFNLVQQHANRVQEAVHELDEFAKAQAEEQEQEQNA